MNVKSQMMCRKQKTELILTNSRCLTHTSKAIAKRQFLTLKFLPKTIIIKYLLNNN